MIIDPLMYTRMRRIALRYREVLKTNQLADSHESVESIMALCASMEGRLTFSDHEWLEIEALRVVVKVAEEYARAAHTGDTSFDGKLLDVVQEALRLAFERGKEKANEP